MVERLAKGCSFLSHRPDLILTPTRYSLFEYENDPYETTKDIGAACLAPST